MTRVAALDCGTNSLRLLIADIDADRLVDVVRRMEIVRLGEGVDRTGRLSEAALERTFGVLDSYAEQIRDRDASRIRMVATSATRDASNRDAFVDGVRRRLGVPPEVITGDQEAGLSFDGATRELRGSGLAAPYLVVDIGGGSTEFVLGTERVLAARSVDIGCVRMTERHLRSDPPTEAQIAGATGDIDAAIDLAAETVDLAQAKTLVGLAGSVTTVAAVALGLERYDRSRIHLSRIPADVVRRTAVDLLTMSREQRAAIPVMHPGRVDVIGAGALVLARIVDRLGLSEVVVSEHDILDGIAYSLV
jgi:exopolyphosphatase/guanosine-5'-triphosphate,3'-diphosphate pyrophosphatase